MFGRVCYYIGMMKNTMKYANAAKSGDYIRAYDFRPMADRPDRYVDGVVIDAADKTRGFDAFKIEVMHDEAFPDRPREIVYVPHEVSFLEYDGRVVVLETPKYGKI